MSFCYLVVSILVAATTAGESAGASGPGALEENACSTMLSGMAANAAQATTWGA
jgi:hypothetical protein